ncbi:MAG: thioredoxin family protein, partial [Allomuricauda sp.]
MELNENIPDWELLPIFEDSVPQLKDFKGKPLLILFFNLGCPGCKGRALPFANRVVFENGKKVN